MCVTSQLWLWYSVAEAFSRGRDFGEATERSGAVFKLGSCPGSHSTVLQA